MPSNYLKSVLSRPLARKSLPLLVALTGGLFFTSKALAVEELSGQVRYDDASVEANLNNGDYDAAISLLQRRVKESGKGQTIKDAYLHTALMESLLWQGRISEAQNEAKKTQTIVDAVVAQAKSPADQINALELKTRFLDTLSWIYEALSQDVKSQTALDEAIKLLREQRELDRQTWRLIDCLAHKASLVAQSGDNDQARQLLEEALTYVPGSKSVSAFTVADVEEALGGVLYKLGRSDEAQRHFARAVDLKKNSDALLHRFAPHAYWLSPTYRYVQGSKWSSQDYIGGLEHKRIDVGMAVVEAYLQKDKAASSRAIRVGVTVTNRTNNTLQFLPRKPELFLLNPKIVIGKVLDAASLASMVETKSTKKAESLRSDGRHATRTITTYYPNPYRNWNNNGRGRQGFFRSLLSDSQNTGTTQVPDFQAEQEALQKAQQVEEEGRALAEEIRTEGVGPCNIAPRSKLNGFLFFEMKVPRNAGQMMFKLPIGDAQFEFRFDKLP